MRERERGRERQRERKGGEGEGGHFIIFTRFVFNPYIRAIWCPSAYLLICPN